MGEGVLVYPGKQVDLFTEHSIGLDGVIPSIRLKNWRRGVLDAGYLKLARAANPEKANFVAKAVVPRALSEARGGKPAAWSEAGEPWFVARRQLLELIRTNGAANVTPPSIEPASATGGCGSGCRGCDTGGRGGDAALAATALLAAIFASRRRARQVAGDGSGMRGASSAHDRSKSP